MALVFAYGSLAPHLPGTPARLRGYSRTWNVAMDNRVTIPGYKYYLDAAGRRPEVYVTFLNLVPGDGVEGVVIDADLAVLDPRERNYARVDVTEHVDSDLGARVWTYVGSEEGRARFDAGRRAGRAVVARAYLEAVSGLAAPPSSELPVLDLTQVDLP